MYGVRFLAVLLLLVVANSFLNSGEEAINPVAVAAERAESTPGARFSMRFVYSAPALGRSITATGTGVYNAQTDRTRLRLDAGDPVSGETLHYVSVSDGEYSYTSGGTVEDALPPGKKWVREKAGVQDSESPVDIQDSLGMLCKSGEVQMVGHEQVGGEDTRRYRGEISLSDLVDFLREEDKDEIADAYEAVEGETLAAITAESWINSRNLPRRMRMVMPMPGDPGEPTMTIDMQIDIRDYGIRPKIQLPNPATVVEASSLAPEVDSVQS
jgi:hypothetical protein